MEIELTSANVQDFRLFARIKFKDKLSGYQWVDYDLLVDKALDKAARLYSPKRGKLCSFIALICSSMAKSYMRHQGVVNKHENTVREILYPENARYMIDPLDVLIQDEDALEELC